MHIDWRTKKGSIIVKSGKALSLLKQHMHTTTPMVLDVGSGNGLFVEQLADLECTVVSADTKNFLSREAQARASIFRDINLNQRWMFNNDQFDVITAWNVLEHLESPLVFSREACRVLRKGGLLFISMPNIFNLRNRLYFFRTGDMYRYKASNDHFTILTKLTFRKIFLQAFMLLERGFVGPEPPFEFLSKHSSIRYRFPETELFSHTIYYVLRKRSES